MPIMARKRKQQQAPRRRRGRPAGQREWPADNPWPRRLYELRQRLDITQREAAERCGVAIGTWQNWEYGHRHPGAAAQRLISVVFSE